MIFFGAHLSMANGYFAMGKNALEIGADTLQFFTRNPRGGSRNAPPNPPQHDIDDFLDLMKKRHFGPVIAHAPYTINLCSADENIRDVGKMLMRSDLNLLQRFDAGTVLYNFHPGCHVGQGAEKGIQLTAQALNEILTEETHTHVLLETMSGKGSEIGASFEEIAQIMNLTNLKCKLGVCLDTCHVFSAGYDIVGRLEEVIEEFDKIIGMKHLQAIHINDSMTPFASHKDRHAITGKGTIGLTALKAMTRLKCFDGLPMVLETPNDLFGYAEEIRILREETP